MSETTSMPPRRSRLMMALPFAALMLAALGWSAYWWVLSGEIEDAARQWVADQRAAGLTADYGTLGVGGWPFRISLDVEAPVLGAPNAPEPWRWEGGAINAVMQPWNLRHVIMEADGPQRVVFQDPRSGAETAVDASAETILASLVAAEHGLGRFSVDIEGLEAAATSGEGVSAGALRLHIRPAPGEFGPGVSDYDLALRGDGVLLSGSLAPPVLGRALDAFELQARLHDVPHDTEGDAAAVLARWADAGGAIEFSTLNVDWGPLDLDAQGKLSLDDAGRPEGRMMARLNDQQALVTALVDAGLIDAEGSGFAMAGLEILSGLSGAPEGAIDLPITMADGDFYLGPLRVGALQPLY